MARLSFFLTVCATLASAVSAFQLVHFDNVDSVLLEKRQSGDPQYDCHANCGFSIRGAREPEYCGNATWVAWYEGCMDCAVEAGIWSMYGNSVSSAAQACGLSGIPDGLEGAGNATASASAAASATASSAVGSASEAASSVSAAVSSASAAVSSAAASGSAAASAVSRSNSTWKLKLILGRLRPVLLRNKPQTLQAQLPQYKWLPLLESLRSCSTSCRLGRR